MTSDPDRPDDPRPDRPRILLVEDNEAAGKGLARLLEAQGYQVDAVQDGASALKALAAPPYPGLILTDLQLPDMDGREIARFARGLDPAPVVGAVTGWDWEGSGPSASDWGIAWVLTKPINYLELIDRLRQAAPVPTPEAPRSDDGGGQPAGAHSGPP